MEVGKKDLGKICYTFCTAMILPPQEEPQLNEQFSALFLILSVSVQWSLWRNSLQEGVELLYFCSPRSGIYTKYTCVKVTFSPYQNFNYSIWTLLMSTCLHPISARAHISSFPVEIIYFYILGSLLLYNLSYAVSLGKRDLDLKLIVIFLFHYKVRVIFLSVMLHPRVQKIHLIFNW